MEKSIDLSTLSDIQKLKEFKFTKRALISKDIVVKAQAIEKVRNFEYLTEGGCFKYLLKAIKVKRTPTKETNEALNVLVAFLDTTKYINDADKETRLLDITDCIQKLYQCSADAKEELIDSERTPTTEFCIDTGRHLNAFVVLLDLLSNKSYLSTCEDQWHDCSLWWQAKQQALSAVWSIAQVLTSPSVLSTHPHLTESFLSIPCMRTVLIGYLSDVTEQWQLQCRTTENVAPAVTTSSTTAVASSKAKAAIQSKPAAAAPVALVKPDHVSLSAYQQTVSDVLSVLSLLGPAAPADSISDESLFNSIAVYLNMFDVSSIVVASSVQCLLQALVVVHELALHGKGSLLQRNQKIVHRLVEILENGLAVKFGDTGSIDGNVIKCADLVIRIIGSLFVPVEVAVDSEEVSSRVSHSLLRVDSLEALEILWAKFIRATRIIVCASKMEYQLHDKAQTERDSMVRHACSSIHYLTRDFYSQLLLSRPDVSGDCISTPSRDATITTAIESLFTLLMRESSNSSDRDMVERAIISLLSFDAETCAVSPAGLPAVVKSALCVLRNGDVDARCHAVRLLTRLKWLSLIENSSSSDSSPPNTHELTLPHDMSLELLTEFTRLVTALTNDTIPPLAADSERCEEISRTVYLSCEYIHDLLDRYMNSSNSESAATATAAASTDKLAIEVVKAVGTEEFIHSLAHLLNHRSTASSALSQLVVSILTMLTQAHKRYRHFYSLPNSPDPLSGMPASQSPCRYINIMIALVCGKELLQLPDSRGNEEVLVTATLDCIAHMCQDSPESIIALLECVATDLALQSCTDRINENTSTPEMPVSLPRSEWTTPKYFSDIFPEVSMDDIASTASDVDNTISRRVAPFVTVMTALTTLLKRPSMSHSFFTATMRAVSALCATHLLAEANQPVVCNIFAALFVSLGGYAAAVGYIGRSNVLLNGYVTPTVGSEEFNTEQLAKFNSPIALQVPFATEYELLKRLLRRGQIHDEFWCQLYLDKWNQVQLELDHASNVQRNRKSGKASSGREVSASTAVPLKNSAAGATVLASKLSSAKISTAELLSPLMQKCMNFPSANVNTHAPECTVADVKAVKAEAGEYNPLTLTTAHASVYPENCDPNRGPSHLFWQSVFRQHYSDIFNESDISTLLVSALVGNLTDLSLLLIENDACVNVPDAHGTYPVMYALALRNHRVLRSLLAHGCHLNVRDIEGNPALKYCFAAPDQHTLSEIVRMELLTEQAVSCPHQRSVATVRCFEPFALEEMLSAGASIYSRDAMGNHALHWCCDQVRVGLSLGRTLLACQFQSNDNVMGSLTRVDLIKSVLAHTKIPVEFLNMSNIHGVVVLHLLAGLGDISSLQLVLSYNDVYKLPLDANGNLPVHYAALMASGSCHVESTECMSTVRDYLLSVCSGDSSIQLPIGNEDTQSNESNSLYVSYFSDDGEYEMARCMGSSFESVLNPWYLFRPVIMSANILSQVNTDSPIHEVF